MRVLDPIRVQRVDDGSLTALLQKYWERARRQSGKIQAQVARDASPDESYVSRLISGERVYPSRDGLILLGAWGLEVPVHELEEVLMAADYKPLVVRASLR